MKYTYFGDANLDGMVNGSDYTLIDNGFNNNLTGWRNGDFNYDGIINGDDYTLIDNAFNTQGSPLAMAALASSPTAQIATAPPTSASAIVSMAKKPALAIASIFSDATPITADPPASQSIWTTYFEIASDQPDRLPV